MCPYCNSVKTVVHEKVKRLVRGKYGRRYAVYISRRMCKSCKRTFREESELVLPYKHYEKEIIFGVIEGLITAETLGFEDYPSEITMKRWRSQIKQLL